MPLHLLSQHASGARLASTKMHRALPELPGRASHAPRAPWASLRRQLAQLQKIGHAAVCFHRVHGHIAVRTSAAKDWSRMWCKGASSTCQPTRFVVSLQLAPPLRTALVR
jgi:hypothetical protein